jgi:hypothetical protein
MQPADCIPNFSPAGRVRRWTIAIGGGAIGAAVLGLCILTKAPWFARSMVVVPMSVGFGSFLQVSRGTCVVHARHGTFEHDDMSVTLADPATVAASRRVAATIYRDAVVFGVVCAALAAATVLL